MGGDGGVGGVRASPPYESENVFVVLEEGGGGSRQLPPHPAAHTHAQKNQKESAVEI